MSSVRILKAVCATACAALVSACALTRSEIAVPVTPTENPPTGAAVVVQSVVDERRFEAAPPEPSTPSLKEAAQISDPQVTSRALGRKRNGFGQAMGDVLLTPPQTVTALVGEAVKNGLRDAGYRVIEANDPAGASAPKLDVRIAEFWTWVTPGFMIKLDHSTNVSLQGTLAAVRSPATLTVRDTKSFVAITESQWAPVITESLGQLRQKVRSLFAPVTASRDLPPGTPQ